MVNTLTQSCLHSVPTFLTVTLQVAFFLEPSAAVAVMVAVPLETAETLPLLSTLATLVLLDFHVTLR